MKRIYLVLMMLGMLISALNFTACGGYDDGDTIDNGGAGAGTSSTFTMTRDGKVYESDVD